MFAIRTQNLAKSYKNVHALKPLSLDVRQGEIFGLLGPNGAGKTTLVKLLLGMIKPTEGNAFLFDVNIKSAIARQKVGYLPEHHRFPPYLTATQFLQVYGEMGGLHAKDVAERIPQALAMVDMESWKDMKLGKCSKGMQQRLGLAQALLSDPELIFLDEPTDGLDPVGRKEVRDVLIRLKEAGKTIFLNSHLLSEIESLCDRVAILNKGELVREGLVSEFTRLKHRFVIKCGIVPPHLRFEDPTVQVRTENNESSITFTARDPEFLNMIIDVLRRNEVLIFSVESLKQSLEDYFVKVITE